MTLTLKFEILRATNAHNAFDVEVLIFQSDMRVEGVKVIKPFFSNLQNLCDVHQVPNMLVIMFDLCFKSSSCGKLPEMLGLYSSCFRIGLQMR